MKTHITFEIEVTDVAGFIARLGLAGVAPNTIEHEGVSDTATTEGPSRSRRSRSTSTETATDAAPMQETTDAAPRSRRSRTEAVDTATPTDVQPPASAEATGSRRRRSGAVDAPVAPVGISDLDLSKGASEAAEALTKLGDKGQEIVADVLKEDFKVEHVAQIPADRRQAFLDELQNQVALAQADAAKAA